jgi:hypothetical protein
MLSGILAFLRHKYGFDTVPFTGDILEEIAGFEGIPIKWVEIDSEESGCLCWEDGPTSFRPTIFLRKNGNPKSTDLPVTGFTMAHELGHFFLHPFLKYIDLDKVKSSSQDLKILNGIAQFEADQFAAIAFLPTKDLSQKFENRVIEALLNDDSSALKNLRQQVYNHCIDQAKILVYPEALRSKDLSAKAKKNILLRTQNFLNQVQDKIFLYYGRPDPPVNLRTMSNAEKASLFEKIRHVLETYEDVSYGEKQ